MRQSYSFENKESSLISLPYVPARSKKSIDSIVPRIALLLPNLNGGGTERVAVNFADGFVRRSCEFDIHALVNEHVPRLTLVAGAQAMSKSLAVPVDCEALKRSAYDFAPEIAAKKYLKLLSL